MNAHFSPAPALCESSNRIEMYLSVPCPGARYRGRPGAVYERGQSTPLRATGQEQAPNVRLGPRVRGVILDTHRSRILRCHAPGPLAVGRGGDLY